jgi:anti-repressor protein
MIPQHAPSGTSLTPFTYHNQPVRTMQHADGTTWWVAADVCAVLGLGKASRACDRLKDSEKGSLIHTPGGEQGGAHV